MDNVITASVLTKKFGTIIAVDGLSLDIKAGEIYGFLGLNGAGTVSYTHLTLPTKRIV